MARLKRKALEMLSRDDLIQIIESDTSLSRKAMLAANEAFNRADLELIDQMQACDLMNPADYVKYWELTEREERLVKEWDEAFRN